MAEGGDTPVVPGSIADIPTTDIAGLAPPVNPYAGLPWPPPSWDMGGAFGMPPIPPPAPLNVGPLDTGPGPLDEARAPIAPPAPEPATPGGQTVADVLGAPTTEPVGGQPAAPTGPATNPLNPLGALDVSGPADRLKQQAKWANDPLNPQAGLDLTPEQRGQLYADMDPVQRAGYDAKRTAIQQQDAIAKLHEEALANAQRQQAAWEDYTKAHAAATAAHDAAYADAMKLANQKMDPDHWRNSRSTFQSIAGALSVITGGLAQGAGFKGGNPGLEMINKAIDNDMSAQRENLTNARAVAGMRLSATHEGMQQATEDYRMLATHNIALHETAVQALQTEAQQYDPNGTTAQSIGAAIANQKAAQQKIAQDLYEKTLEQNLKISKDRRETAAQLETERHNKADEQHANWATSITAAEKKAEQTVHPPEWYAAHYGAGEAPATPMTEKQYSTFQETKGKIAERGTKADELQRKDEASTVYGPPAISQDKKTGELVRKAQPLIKGDGKTPFRFADPAEKAKFQVKQDAVSSVVASIDELKRTRERFGNTDYSDVVKSPDWQAAHTHFSNAVSKLMQTEGFQRFTKEDKEQMEDMLGGLHDPTRWNGIRPGLDAARATVLRDLNQELEHSGYDGKPIQIEDTSAPPPVKNTPLQKVADLATSRKITKDQLDEAGYDARGLGGGKISDDAAAQVRNNEVAKLMVALRDPAQAADAEKLLREIAKNGPTADVRGAAELALSTGKDVGNAKPLKPGDFTLPEHPVMKAP
jgi:hypothetical protein